MDEKCYVEPINKTALESVLQNADSALLAVSGMGCQNCATRVRNGLLLLEEVFYAQISLNMGLAEVFYDGRKVSVEALVNAVVGSGNDGRHEYRAEIVAK